MGTRSPRRLSSVYPDWFPTCQRRIRDSSPDPTLLHLELLTTCQWCLSLFGSEDCRTLSGAKGVRNPANGLAQGFQGA
jgi:hypothetical protein